MPEGYKKTKVGIIPKDWNIAKLSEVFEKSFYGTSESTKEKGKYPVLRMGNMQNGSLQLDDLVYIDLEEKDFIKYQLKKGDILLNRTNSYELVGKISLFDLDEDYISASYIVSYRPNKNKLDSIFINNLLNTNYFQNKIKILATKGVSQANINPTAFKEIIRIPLPPLAEQEKIAKILTTWDQALTTQKILIKEKEQLKKGLMQKLLNGEVRFKGFSAEWKEFELSEILKERKTYSEKGLDLEHVSLTIEGVVPKSERYERDQLVKDENKKYKITKLNDICYNPANLKFGVICKNTYGDGIFSPIYVTFEVDKKFSVNFMGYYLTWNDFIGRVRRFEEGTVYERMAVSPKDFISYKAKLPSRPEQEKIVEVLSTIDKDLDLLKIELEELKQQKKGLMQKLLTGKVRV